MGNIQFYKDGTKLVLVIEGMSEFDEQAFTASLAAFCVRKIENAMAEQEPTKILEVDETKLQPVSEQEQQNVSPETAPEEDDGSEQLQLSLEAETEVVIEDIVAESVPISEPIPEASLKETYAGITDIKGYVLGLAKDDVLNVVDKISAKMTDEHTRTFFPRYNVVNWTELKELSLDRIQSAAMNLIYMVQTGKIA